MAILCWGTRESGSSSISDITIRRLLVQPSLYYKSSLYCVFSLILSL